MPLLAYLDDPPDTGRVFRWLCPCVRELLNAAGKLTVEFEDAIRLAQQQAVDGMDIDEVERRAGSFWVRRRAGDVSFTAVAQLLFALSRLDRSQGRWLEGAASTPLMLLEEIEPQPGHVFEHVIKRFSEFVA
jgi:hypothetical protein